MVEKEYLTQDKYNELKNELNELLTVKRREVAEQLQYAKGMGDLSENAEYHEAREEQAKTEARISQLESILKNSEILQHKRSELVEIGSEVTIQKTGEKETQKYIIVGLEEADITQGKISNHSPLGLSLLGKKKGDTFDFKTPKGKTEYTVVDIK